MTFNSFQDLFTRDEIRLLSDVKETGKPIIFPILLRAPNQYEHGGTITLRLYYAMQVWAAAYAKVADKYANGCTPLNNYVWETWNESFRIVRFTNPNHKEMLQAFWKELERIADSGEIKVSEGESYRMDKKEAWQMEKEDHNKRFKSSTVIRTVVDAPDVTQMRKQNSERVKSQESTEQRQATSSFLSTLLRQIRNIFSPPPPPPKAVKETLEKAYTWDEIKVFFVELPEKLISLLEEERMYRYEKADVPLFEACEQLDLEGVKKAVANGANVNALDKSRGSAIKICCEEIMDLFRVEVGENRLEGGDGNILFENTTPENTAIIEKYTTAAFNIISFLLENGAIIDLCGSSDTTPLYESIYFPNTKLMRFLLEHGAKPNVNCWNDKYKASAVLEAVWDSMSCIGETRCLIEMERLLLEYGVRIHVDGYDAAKEWASYNGEEWKEPEPPTCLIQRVAKLSKLDKRLYIACVSDQISSILNTLSAGANINLRDNAGWSLLSVVIEYRNEIRYATRKAYYEEELLTVVICLLGQKIQLTAEDILRAIHLARQHGYTKIAARLDDILSRLFAGYTTLSTQQKQSTETQNLTTFNSFQDLFSRDEIRLLVDVKETENPIMFPILLCAPDQFDCYLGSGKHDETVTLRLYYAMQVWAAAYANISERECSHTPLNSYVWEDWNETFRIVRFTNTNHKEMLLAFWKELERIANSGEIKVSEGRFRRMEKRGACQEEEGRYNGLFERSTGIQVVVDTNEIIPSHKRGKDYVLTFKGTSDKTYSWDDIKNLFVELSEKLISCIGEERMHRHEKADTPLFEACKKLDLDRVKEAVANGANVNALNSMGNSAITTCCKAIREYPVETDVCTSGESSELPSSEVAILGRPTALAFRIISFLLEKGAKIDLCGGYGKTPLCQAQFSENVMLMRFLLEHGASPNVCCDLTDDPERVDIASSALDGVWEDQSCEGESIRLLESERLLLKYGALYHINGFAPYAGQKDSFTDKITQTPDSLIQPTAEFSELDRRLYIACAEVHVRGILDALSEGANINLRDDEGRNLLAVAIEFGSQIGAVIHKAEYGKRLWSRILAENSDLYFGEKLLTVVICLLGQKIQLTSEEIYHAVKLAYQYDYTSVATWLVEKQARLSAGSAPLATQPTTI